ncbi:hypothetical protein VTO73DRAFT_13584 [Trametes versicolor]
MLDPLTLRKKGILFTEFSLLSKLETCSSRHRASNDILRFLEDEDAPVFDPAFPTHDTHQVTEETSLLVGNGFLTLKICSLQFTKAAG